MGAKVLYVAMRLCTTGETTHDGTAVRFDKGTKGVLGMLPVFESMDALNAFYGDEFVRVTEVVIDEKGAL